MAASVLKKTRIDDGNVTNSPEGEDLINRLPHTVLIEIFSKLKYADQCRCAQVCHSWNRLTRDYSLRKSIRLHNYFLKYHSLLSLVRYHFTEHLLIFELKYQTKMALCVEVYVIERRLHGSAPDNRFWRDFYYSVDKEILCAIAEKAPRIKKIAIKNYSIGDTNLGDFPLSLTHLSLRNTLVEPQFFSCLSQNVVVPNLTCLDLSYAKLLSSQDMRNLNCLQTLKALFLQDCKRFNNGGIDLISKLLPNLEILDVEGTEVADEGVCIIFEKCVKLKRLYMASLDLTGLWLSKFETKASDKLEVLCIDNMQQIMSFLNVIKKRQTQLLIQYNTSSFELTTPVKETALFKNITLLEKSHKFHSHYWEHSEFGIS